MSYLKYKPCPLQAVWTENTHRHVVLVTSETMKYDPRITAKLFITLSDRILQLKRWLKFQSDSHFVLNCIACAGQSHTQMWVAAIDVIAQRQISHILLLSTSHKKLNLNHQIICICASLLFSDKEQTLKLAQKHNHSLNSTQILLFC